MLVTTNPNLEELSVHQCRKIDDDVMPDLLKLKKLRRLDLGSTNINGNQLRRLTELTKLEWLVYSTDSSSKGAEMTPVDLHALSAIHTIPFGFQRLQEFDDQDFATFLAQDLSNVKEMTIRATHITAESAKVLAAQPFEELRFYDCTIDPNAIEQLDWETTPMRFDTVPFKFVELAKCIGPTLEKPQGLIFWEVNASLYPGIVNTDFDYVHSASSSSHADGRFHIDEITGEAFKHLANIHSISVKGGHSSQIVSAYREAGLSVPLTLRAKGDMQCVWDEIAKTPLIKRLCVIDRSNVEFDAGVPRFTEEHQITHLRLAFPFDSQKEAWFIEIAKLNRLQEFEMEVTGRLPSKLSLLGSLPRLKKVIIVRPDFRKKPELAYDWSVLTEMGFSNTRTYRGWTSWERE